MASFTMKLKVYQCKHASRCCEERKKHHRNAWHNCPWDEKRVNETDDERATENKFREFVVVWVVFREWAATPSASQPASCEIFNQAVNQQTSLIKNENIINSTTLFFLVGIVVVATNSIITSLSFELRYRMHVLRRRHKANDKMIPAFTFFQSLFFFGFRCGQAKRRSTDMIICHISKTGAEGRGQRDSLQIGIRAQILILVMKI